MSEEDIKINGVVQVGKFLIIGAVYIAFLYLFAMGAKSQLLDFPALVNFTEHLKNGLTKYGDNAKIILIAILVFLSIISGLLINDLIKKFSIISLLLFLVITAIDFAPIKLLIEGPIK